MTVSDIDEASDPKIVDRLKKIPPFDEEKAPDIAPDVLTAGPDEEETSNQVVEPAASTEEPAKTEQTEAEKKKQRTSDEFTKLKEHNAQLKAELEKVKIPTQNALEGLMPQNPPPPITNVIPTVQQYPGLAPKEIKDTFANLTDDQGYVDTGLLKETLVSLQKAKDEAEAKLKVANERVDRIERNQGDFERNRVMREVHSRFPRLNPENALAEDDTKFDQTFYDLFQGEIVRQWTTVGEADAMKVAEKISGILYKEDMKKVDKEKAEAAELAKKNINATTVKPTSTVNRYNDQDDLIRATRNGVPGSLAERLRRIGQ